jgi:ribosomal protein S18 acetylase RimI-like enzyme
MACIYKINGKTFNTTEEIQNYVSSDEFVSVLAKGNSGISKEVRNLILNKDEKTTNEAPKAGSKSKSSEPSKSDKNYQEAQDVNAIVSKENPEASVLIQPKGEDLSLTAVYVGKEKRGKGIGSKVLESVKKQADKLGKKVVLDATNELDSETDLEKLDNFYKKNGFLKIGENKYEYDPKAKDSSGDIGSRTDDSGTKKSDIAAVTNKGQSDKNVDSAEEVTEGGVKAPQVTEPALRDVESTLTALGNLDIYWFDDFQNKFGEGIKSAKDVSEAYHKAKADDSNPELVEAVESLLSKEETKNKENAIQKPSTNEEVSRNGETRKNQPESSQGVRQGEQGQEATPQVKEANVKAIEEAITKKSGTIKNEIIKEAANPTEVKKILDNLDAIKSKLAGFKTKDGDRIFSEECKWG